MTRSRSLAPRSLTTVGELGVGDRAGHDEFVDAVFGGGDDQLELDRRFGQAVGEGLVVEVAVQDDQAAGFARGGAGRGAVTSRPSVRAGRGDGARGGAR
ncbi:hypothetical protein [Streptomyces sp. NPDC059862]|uniref:hypothetical protein n=1 Tax=unclassified Streptomyces TaxID=2593676 RepID=UPI0036302915